MDRLGRLGENYSDVISWCEMVLQERGKPSLKRGGIMARGWGLR